MLAIGTPSFTTYLQASKLASAAQSYLTGVQLARAEAIRRNQPVEFVLTDLPIAPNIQNVAGLNNPNGRNWLVRVLNPGPPATFDLIEAKSALEGSFTSTGVPSITVIGAAAAPAVFDGTLSFNGFGAITPVPAAYTLDLRNPSGGACAPAGPMRCPQIRVSAGGQAHLCDPIAAAGDSRAC
ncbi:MAG: GspH/FimT family pseudopilin [Pseudomonadota bacterium]|nr:GspH/FimT family pseudopilin [Pseudomonadota bacterium]